MLKTRKRVAKVLMQALEGYALSAGPGRYNEIPFLKYMDMSHATAKLAGLLGVPLTEKETINAAISEALRQIPLRSARDHVLRAMQGGNYIHASYAGVYAGVEYISDYLIWKMDTAERVALGRIPQDIHQPPATSGLKSA